MIIKVFISYAHEDRTIAEWLAGELKKNNIDYWYDKGITGGDDWLDEIERALKSCNVQVVILTPESVNPKSFVKKEYLKALNTEMPIIPLIFKKCEVPIALYNLQWIDFVKNRQQGINELVISLNKLTKIKAMPEPTVSEGRSLSAPSIRIKNSDDKGVILSWSNIQEASSYILETSTNPQLFLWFQIYAGEKTEYFQSATDKNLGLVNYRYGVNQRYFPSTLLQSEEEKRKNPLFNTIFDQYQNKSETYFFRVKAKGIEGKTQDSSWSNVVVYTPPKPKPLTAPTLKAESGLFGPTKLSWNSVLGATGYILEKAYTLKADNWENVYEGNETEFADFSLSRTRLTSPYSFLDFQKQTFLNSNLSTYYRVKAKGGLGNLDSSWSIVVEYTSPKPKPLTAPTLKLKSESVLFGSKLSWNSVLGATGYILEKAQTPKADKWENVFEGNETEFTDFTDSGFSSTLGTSSNRLLALQKHTFLNTNSSTYYYRVKAKGGLRYLDSSWSNVVEVNPK